MAFHPRSTRAPTHTETVGRIIPKIPKNSPPHELREYSPALRRYGNGKRRLACSSRGGTHKKWSKRSPSEETPLSNDPLFNPSQLARFEQVVLPHLDSAYNLARWLTGNEHDAEDVVQDAYLRAVKFFDSFRGGDARPWLITIVRRVCYDWLERNRSHQSLAVFDEELHSDQGDSLDPAQLALRQERPGNAPASAERAAGRIS